MPVTFDILDETTAGERRGAGSFDSDAEVTTVREIIRLRVRQEVERFNASDQEVFRGLIEPHETEQVLNRVRARRVLDWERQYASAIGAFQSNGFLVLVDDCQVTELDERVELRPETRVTFLKLVPLIGG